VNPFAQMFVVDPMTGTPVALKQIVATPAYPIVLLRTIDQRVKHVN